MATLGVLLAGGRSRRMGGGDKCLRKLGGETLLARIINRARPQVDELVINANGDAVRFDSFGLSVVPDVVEGHPGPLAGVLTGLEWAAENRPEIQWVATMPTDAPFLPRDLVARMRSEIDVANADMVCAASAGRDHPVVGIWPVRLRDDLRRAMVNENIRKVDIWTARYRLARAEFPTDPVDPFFNTNRPEDLEEATRLLQLNP